MATMQRPGTTPETATERAETGAETARAEGHGAAGQAVEAAKNAATGRDEPAVVDRSGVVEPGAAAASTSGTARSLGAHHHRDNGVLGRTEEEVARLRTRTQITKEGDAYCPNPNIRDLVRRFVKSIGFVV